jgi:TonB-dependent starch-binding outer membrane protein SusC
MIGMEANKWWYYDISGTRTNLPSSDPWMLYFKTSSDGTSDIQNVQGTGDNSASVGYFGRINYDYKSKYLLTVNFRHDGSSSFGPNYRWGNFPSFSLGWKFSEEQFVKNIPQISFGKLRFGYGQTGANARTGFPFLSSVVSNTNFQYSFDNSSELIGTGPYQIANPEIRWESINMSNLGLDMGFFDNRLSISADLFKKVNEGMLMQKEVSAIAGVFNGSNPEVNFGSVQNTGYEITITARKKDGDLKGSIDLNLTGVRNKVITLATDSMLNGAVHVLSPTNMTCEGSPVAQFWGYKWDRSKGNGLFRETDPIVNKKGKDIFTNQPFTINSKGDTVYAQALAKAGDVRFLDVNGDGKVNSDDKTVLGSPLPKLVFGFSVNLEYKGFDLSAFFNGTIGNKILNGMKQYTYYLQGNGNHAAEFANRYVEKDIVKKDVNGNDMIVTPKHLDTDIPRDATANYNVVSEFFIEDGSYLMLKNVVLGYTVPQNLTSKIGLEKIRVYVGSKNLFTLTKYSGFSPEVAGIQPQANSTSILESGVDLGVYPSTRMVYFGLNVAF